MKVGFVQNKAEGGFKYVIGWKETIKVVAFRPLFALSESRTTTRWLYYTCRHVTGHARIVLKDTTKILIMPCSAVQLALSTSNDHYYYYAINQGLCKIKVTTNEGNANFDVPNHSKYVNYNKYSGKKLHSINCFSLPNFKYNCWQAKVRQWYLILTRNICFKI